MDPDVLAAAWSVDDQWTLASVHGHPARWNPRSVPVVTWVAGLECRAQAWSRLFAPAHVGRRQVAVPRHRNALLIWEVPFPIPVTAPPRPTPPPLRPTPGRGRHVFSVADRRRRRRTMLRARRHRRAAVASRCAASLPAMPVGCLPADAAIRPEPRRSYLLQTLRVEGVPMEVHIDSCSPFCLVNTNSLSLAQRAHVRPYAGPRLISCNAGGMQIWGTYSGLLEIEAVRFSVPWLVANNLPMQHILGWDFAVRHLDLISPRSNSMRVIVAPPPDLSSWVIPPPPPAALAVRPAPASTPLRLPLAVSFPSAPIHLVAAQDPALALCAELRRLHLSAVQMVSAPVMLPVMPHAATAELTMANVANLVASGGTPPYALLPSPAAMDPDPFFVRASGPSGLAGLAAGSPPSEASSESLDGSLDSGSGTLLGCLADAIAVPSACCTVVRVAIPQPPLGCSLVALALDPEDGLRLPAAALPSASLSKVHEDARGHFAFVCVNNVTSELLHLKAGTALCDVSFLYDDSLPVPPHQNIVLRLPWLEWLRLHLGLLVAELNGFRELYQSNALADSNFGEDDWWINPLWQDLEHALHLVHVGRPRRFIILGPVRGSSLTSPMS